MLIRSVDQAVFILGDFNTCDWPAVKPTQVRVLSIDRTLDRCYGAIPEAYVAHKTPLGRSDHNVIHLIPRSQWDYEGTEALNGSVESIDWRVFLDSCSDNPGELVDRVASYR